MKAMGRNSAIVWWNKGAPPPPYDEDVYYLVWDGFGYSVVNASGIEELPWWIDGHLLGTWNPEWRWMPCPPPPPTTKE